MMQLEQLAAGGRDRLVPAMRCVLTDLRRDAPCHWDAFNRAVWTSMTTGSRELVNHPAFRVGA